MIDLKPCPLCNENLWPCDEGFEHPSSDTCPLDDLWLPERHIDAWNTRAPSAELIAARKRIAELEAALTVIGNCTLSCCETMDHENRRHARAALAGTS